MMTYRIPFKHLKSKISRMLVVYIVLFSSIVTLILTAIQLRMDYTAGINVIHQRIKQIELTNLDSITQALWTMDNLSVQIQLDGLTRITNIIFVEIMDKNKKLVAVSGEINTKNIIKKNIVLEREYRGKKTKLGSLMIVSTKENVYQQLIDAVVVIFISQAVKTFLVSLFMLSMFYYLVTRHLESIARHSDKLDLSSTPQLLRLDRSDSNMLKGDELDRVVVSINRMSNNIHQSYNELINSQQALADREAKFSAMFDAMTDVIIFADSERKIIQTNPAFHSQFGYKVDEVKGEFTQMLYADPEQFSKQGKACFNPNEPALSSRYEVEYRRKDGTVFPSETMGGPIYFSDGSLVGYLGIIRDISDRKQAEEDQSKLQKQLQQAQKMEAVGQLTGGIAHDFNNILAGILGYAELTKELVENYDDPRLIKYIDHINTAGERARELVLQLLSFSRGAAGELKPLKLPILINDVVSLLRPSIPSSIVLRTEINEHVPLVVMDSTQMHQILMNLCINARDSMKGNGRLTIKLAYEANVNASCNSCHNSIRGDYVKLTVEDTGSGIAVEMLDNIFDPFFTTKDIGKGTGMGLSVVHGILHRHQSHIIVETELNVGTKFHLLIPAVSEEYKIENTKPSSIRLSNTIGRGKHILVVDDEEVVGNFLQEFLQIYGYKITAVTSSKEALELVKQSAAEFDLIITDQTMPELTGVEMIKEIFKLTQDIPVILCSGYSDQVDEEKALQLGCAKYLDKPVNNQVLIQAVYGVLSAKINVN